MVLGAKVCYHQEVAMLRTIRIAICLSFIAHCTAPTTLWAQAAVEVDARLVNLSIDRAVAFLVSTQDKTTHTWQDIHGQPGGLTSLCCLAMLNAGVPASDGRVKPALESLVKQGKPSMVYASSLAVMALSAAYPTAGERKSAYAAKIKEHALWLEAVQIKEGDRKGGWRYSRETGQGDNSNAQFALLALHDAEKTLPDIKINDQTWRLALQYFLEQQTEDGSWGYIKSSRAGGGIFGSPSGSMTCAGISSVIIASGELGESSAKVVDGTVLCCGAAKEDSAVERGLTWLGRHFSVDKNPNSPSWQLYYLYGVERVGRLSGRRFFYSPSGKPRDWYREGAELLINHRRDELTGRFFGTSDDEERVPELATALSILFLAKGRRPVVMAKLQHGEPVDNDWDHHPMGVQHLTTHIESLWKRDLTWQSIGLRNATLTDLMEAPVLFLSGQEALNFSTEQKKLLKEYVQQGGFIFAEACDGNGCNGKEFDSSFRQLMKELFPESALRLLPPDHPVWFAEEKVNPKYVKPLYGLDTCCRTAVVYCPENLSCFWELKKPRRGKELPVEVIEQVAAAAAMGANVVAYATNRELKEKLDRPKIAFAAISGDKPRQGALLIPKLAHGGGSDDAPNALRNLARTLEQQVEIRIDQRALLVPPSHAELFKHPLAFIHGRRAFQFTAAERTALRDYLERGGMLFGDAICAHAEFASSFRKEMELVFPEAKWERIPVDHPMFTKTYRGFDLRQVQLRDPQLKGVNDKLTARLATIEPYLEGLKRDDRYVVIFSPYDLSCALENSQSLECKGYIRDDAVRIATNIVLYALGE
jgi:Domain of unknown function (DUF4159)